MIADGMRCGVCVRTPDMGWLRARGGPLWYRRYLPLALLLLGGAGAVASLAATVRALSFRAEGSYDPPGPSTGVARSLARQWSIPLFAGGCALTFLLAGAAPQVLRGRRLKRRTWLVLHGRRIDTELLGVGRNALALWGDEHPYRIYSQWLCVPESIKKTSIKPSGTVSLLPGVTPGIHYAHSEYYHRTIRIDKTSPLVEPLRRAGYRLGVRLRRQHLGRLLPGA